MAKAKVITEPVKKVPATKAKTVAKPTFAKPGQKFETPKKTDSLYRFYTSTLVQKNGNSVMALKWCVEHGVFAPKHSAKYEAMLKMAQLSLKK